MSNKKVLYLLILWILFWTVLQAVIEKEDPDPSMVCIELPKNGTWYECKVEVDEKGRLIKRCNLMDGNNGITFNKKRQNK